MKKLLFALLSMLVIEASAYDFAVQSIVYPEGGVPVKADTTMIYYAINDDGNTVSVVRGPEAYNAYVIQIPSVVAYGGKNYTVTKIGSEAFAESNVGEVRMADTVEEILTDAFYKSSVSKVQFSKGLKYIRERAFVGAGNLTEAIFYEGLLEIGNMVFTSISHWGVWGEGNTTLSKVSLPSSLRKLGERAFYRCTSLSIVEMPARSDMKEIPNEAFIDCPISSIKLPEGIEKIGESAFSGNHLTSISFPSSLKEIGVFALAYNFFETITLPNTITKLGDLAFSQCPYLKSFTFPSSLTEIPNGVFGHGWGGCPQLVEVIIPNGVTKIGNNVFQNCSLLSTVTLPESVIEIGENLFKGSGIQKFTFPTKVSTIPRGMFEACNQLTSIVIPDFIESIADDAFYQCSNLSNITISKSIKYIGGNVFSACPIKSLSISNSLESCGGLLYGCTQLKEFHMSRAIPPTAYWYLGDKEELAGTTLLVPLGCKATYAADERWNVFGSIVEENVDGGVYYQVSTSVEPEGRGTIMVNDQEESEGRYKIAVNSKVTLTIYPADGWHLETLTINDKDVTEDVVDDTYSIRSLTASLVVAATFAENPPIKGDVNDDGTVDVADIATILSIMAGQGEVRSYHNCPDENHPHLIDLGLPSGTKWACCNIGADAPKSSGNHYAWGETQEKESFTWDTYQYGYYNNDNDFSHLEDIGTDIAGTSHDTAKAHWGTSWRMPTREQFQELMDNCTYTYTNQKGVNGLLFTAANGATLFFPAAGRFGESQIYYGGYIGYYWGSSLNEDTPCRASSLYFDSGKTLLNYGDLFHGFQIRAVLKKY